jgi:hypothetical protein
MATQAEALSGQLAVERAHLLRFPAQESAEFAAYLRARGVRPEIAAAVIDDVAASSGGVDAALDIHAVSSVAERAVLLSQALLTCVAFLFSASSMASIPRSWARRARQQRRRTSNLQSAPLSSW